MVLIPISTTCGVVGATVVAATEQVALAIFVVVAVASELGLARLLGGAAVPILGHKVFCLTNQKLLIALFLSGGKYLV